MKKRNFIFVFIATIKTIFGVGLAFCQDPLVSVKTIERIKTTVVPIVCGIFTQNKTFDEKKVIGSAFFINEEGHFLTAAHVVDDWLNIRKEYGNNCVPAFYITTGEIKDSTNMRINTFTFIHYIKSENSDMAVCKPNTNPFGIDSLKGKINFVTFEKFQRTKDGTPIAMTGFPMGLHVPITSKGYIGAYSIGNDIIILDINGWPGNSGSPVYLSTEKVIGLVFRGEKEQGGAPALAHSNNAIFDFLSKNNIRFYKDK